MGFDRSDWREVNKQARHGGLLVAKFVIVGVLLVALISIGWAKWVRPAQIDAEADARRESHSYVESQRTFLLQKLSAIREMQVEIEETPSVTKEAQIKAFTREIVERVELIDEDEIPTSVLEYLEEIDQ